MGKSSEFLLKAKFFLILFAKYFGLLCVNFEGLCVFFLAPSSLQSSWQQTVKHAESNLPYR